MKMNYFSDNDIIDLFNSLLPDNYFIYITACADVGCNSFSNELERFYTCEIFAGSIRVL